MPSWHGASNIVNASMDSDEPPTLRRLRESLSNLEQLERQRHEMRDRFEADRDREGDGYFGLKPSLSPRCSSPPNLGLGNRTIGEGTPSLPSWRHTEKAPARPLRESPPRSTTSAWQPPIYRDRLPRDSALSLALEKSQERIDALQRERDEARRHAADQEAEVVKLTMLLERTESEQRALLEERQRELTEHQRSRREHREALEQVAALRSESHQSRSSSEEWRARLERLLQEQRQQIEALEEAGNRSQKELSERTRSSSELGDALVVCLQERASLLHFVVDLLSALQALFYDPTPFASLRLVASGRQVKGAGPHGAPGPHGPYGPHGQPSSTAARARSASRERLYSRNTNAAELASIQGGAVLDSGAAEDVRELVSSLEAEISDASQEFSAQVQRIIAEAELASRTIGLLRREHGEGDAGVQSACAAWLEQERRRRDKLGLPKNCPVPCIDWAEERAQYHMTTRSMETKFAQLHKLKRLLEVRVNAVARKKPLRN